MPYSPTKTWASGNTLTASDLQGNLDGIKVYVHKPPAGDIKTAQWADTKHIMPGVIDAQTTLTHNCSGQFGGQQHSFQSLNYTFLTRWNTTRSAATTRNIIVPETAFSISLGRPASLLYQWWLQVQSRDDGYVDGNSYFVAYKDDATTGATHKFPEQSQAENLNSAVLFNTGVNISGTRYSSGFEVRDAVTDASFAVGLYGRSENGQCIVFSWGVSIELFYL